MDSGITNAMMVAMAVVMVFVIVMVADLIGVKTELLIFESECVLDYVI